MYLNRKSINHSISEIICLEMHQFKYEDKAVIYGGFLRAVPLPPNYAQRFANSAACWSVDQVALSLWLRHWWRGMGSARARPRKTQTKSRNKQRQLPAKERQSVVGW